MLKVPLDYANPAGTVIELGVLRVVATGSDPIGSLVVNPGGPGGAGTEFAVQVAQAWGNNSARERFDLIGLDPRGVGESRPTIDCYTDKQRDDDPIVSGIPAGALTWTAETARTMLQQCAAGSGGAEALAHFGTKDAARDLDVLRAALGDDKLSFLGVSYGTRLGAIYAEMFPGRVRALVLDGAEDPRKDLKQRQLQLFGGLQRSFEQLAKFCAHEPECPLGDNPAQATPALQKLLRPLVKTPMRASDGRTVTFYTAIQGVIVGLYAQEAWPAVIASLAAFKKGNVDMLLALRDAYNTRSAAGAYTNAAEATLAINCLDERQLTVDEATNLVNETNEVAPFLDPGIDVKTHYGCEGWSTASTLDFPYATNIDGLPETLVVSVTGDGLTPHEGGIALADTLGARLLTVDGEQHGATIAGNPCIDDIVANYLVNLKLPDLATRCAL
ncbi:alpha/beta hydrolase [Nakamurella sp. A5-74]|uniref:Alpha/beta hydrolase n=1 Tax=Nakamurella sp. A5-74 TaxID=3158264 RepID=A0AAU8DVE2_9ACTN